MLELIPVCAGDESFLFQVYASTRLDELSPFGWDATQIQNFLVMQFTAQQRSYRGKYPEADHRIILQGDQRAGQLMVARLHDEIVLVDIALLPGFRSAGIGTKLIRQLQAEATEVGKPLRLRVIGGSPARRLYERLGFVMTGMSEPYCAMEWRSHSD